MIDLLIQLVIFCIVGGLLYYVISLIPLPDPFPVVIRICVILILVLVILGMFSGHVPRFR